MTNERFWKIADDFERYYVTGENPYVCLKDVKDLSETIIKENNGDFDESLADFQMFDFRGKEEKATKIFMSVYRTGGKYGKWATQ